MTSTAPTNSGQMLLIDADDTLWENNIFFEKAIADFIAFLNHREFTREQVRAVLNEVERGCILRHGYGIHSFAHALMETFERLAVDPVTPAMHETIRGFAHKVAENPVQILEGVPPTLAYLSARHHLILMTKGNLTEQRGKIERSGLKDYFHATEIVAEKDPPTYRSVIAKYGAARGATWMVGNSPRSDINPALAAGLNAVFVPHNETWVLEHEEIASPPAPEQRLLVLDCFSQLRDHF